jgi:YD repeat-containing protein
MTSGSEYEHDPAGRVVTTTADVGGLEAVSASEYDPGGRLVRTVDPLGHERGGSAAGHHTPARSSNTPTPSTRLGASRLILVAHCSKTAWREARTRGHGRLGRRESSIRTMCDFTRNSSPNANAARIEI